MKKTLVVKILLSLCALFLSCNFTPCAIATESGQNQTIVWDVEGTETIYTGPGKNYPKVINEKASKFLKKEEYANIDNSTQVIIEESKGGWSKIKVIEPSWFSESHRGWVPTKCLIKPDIASDGIRNYKDRDFYWDNIIKPHKKFIVKAINKIARLYPKGTKIDTSTISIAPDRGTKKEPVFFVTIGEDLNAYNLYFSKKDIENNTIKIPQ